MALNLASVSPAPIWLWKSLRDDEPRHTQSMRVDQRMVSASLLPGMRLEPFLDQPRHPSLLEHARKNGLRNRSARLCLALWEIKPRQHVSQQAQIVGEVRQHERRRETAEQRPESCGHGDIGHRRIASIQQWIHHIANEFGGLCR